MHEILDELASLALIRGDQADAAMFRRGAAIVRRARIGSAAEVGPLLDSDELRLSEPDLRRRLRHMSDAGAWVLLESAIADLPADLRWLFESGAVTVAQLAALHRTLDVATRADLAAAIAGRAVRAVPGLDEDVEAAIAAALPDLRRSHPRIPLGSATAIVEPLIERIRALPGVEWVSPVGSLRRGRDTVGDLEVVAAAADPSAAIHQLAQLQTARVLHRSRRRLFLRLDRVQVSLRFPEPAIAGSLMLRLTGSTAHLAQLAATAAERGIDLPVDAATEDELYARLGLPFIPPELREGDEEVRAASEGRLPRLISASDIKGDLHMHTDWSDGRDTMASMVRAGRALGYQYIAITDHSQRSAASRNLTLDGIARQADEIAELREQYPDIEILHGCEVDIMPDGRLDFADRVLERFDVVLASLHDAAGHGPAQLQNRYEAAMRHPLVTLITHPTNRTLPHKPGYDLDYDRLFHTAAETGTAVEIDGAPAHLDLDGALARRATAAGALVAVDSDCHRAEMLGRQMRLGITTARRGWVEPEHVLNARPVADVRAAVARKRER